MSITVACMTELIIIEIEIKAEPDNVSLDSTIVDNKGKAGKLDVGKGLEEHYSDILREEVGDVTETELEVDIPARMLL
jgi:hypothetical protein